MARLTLTRPLGTVIVMELPNGDRITIRVAEIRRNQVRLGFEAPREVSISRGELLFQHSQDEDEE